jgi:hypothetical protein
MKEKALITDDDLQSFLRQKEKAKAECLKVVFHNCKSLNGVCFIMKLQDHPLCGDDEECLEKHRKN